MSSRRDACLAAVRPPEGAGVQGEAPVDWSCKCRGPDGDRAAVDNVRIPAAAGRILVDIVAGSGHTAAVVDNARSGRICFEI